MVSVTSSKANSNANCCTHLRKCSGADALTNVHEGDGSSDNLNAGSSDNVDDGSSDDVDACSSVNVDIGSFDDVGFSEVAGSFDHVVSCRR